MKYCNYHCHSHYSNITLADSGETPKGYIERIKQLGHTVYVSTEHGHSAGFVEKYLLCKKNNIKFVYGVEGYVEFDGRTYHMMFMAKNSNGKTMINRMLYEATVNNYKNKRAKLTLDIIKKYVTKDIVTTNACLGGLFKEPSGQLIDEVYSIFGKNLWIEVAPHDSDKQREMNKRAYSYAKEHNLIIVSANDSHYALDSNKDNRDDLLEAKRINYGEDDAEDDYYLDYPDYDTLVERYRKQGVFTREQAEEFIDNTNRIEEFEDIDMKEGGEFKVPTLYPKLSRADRCKKLISIINQEWDKYKDNVSEDMRDTYIHEIKRELTEIFTCKMEDYFLTAKGIIDKAIEKGGVLTKSSRGSSSSFFVNMLLGFTTIDRIKSHVPILMERFMTAERILGSKTSPDIDFNIADNKPFLEAQEELLGVGHCVPMIAYGLLKPKSAFKMMCKAQGDIPVDLQNQMSSAIESYEFDYNHADDEDKEGIRLENYMDNDELYDLYKKGESYFGIISDSKSHPCGSIIANVNLIDEFGVLKTPKGDICLNLEGKYADDIGYVKLDWLTVAVVDLTDKIYKEIGIKQPPATELYDMVLGDDDTWAIYEKGLVQCVNQVEKSKTRDKVMTYKPKSTEDLCAFISSIRPGFMSYYKRFEKREDFRFGVDSIDNILRGQYLDGSWMMYQEQIMQILQWVGFEGSQTYKILKSISKKKKEVIQAAETKFKTDGVQKLITEGIGAEKAEEVIKSLWQVVLDNSAYGFNSSHSYSMAHDSLWVAYAKAHYPLETYKVCIEFHSIRKEKDKVSKLRKEAEQLGIHLKKMRFRQDNRRVSYSKEKMEIYQSLVAIKGVNGDVAGYVYELKDFQGSWFDFYIAAKENLNKTQLAALIKIGYFEEFGHPTQLLWLVDNFKAVKELSKSKIESIYSANESTMNCSYEEFEEGLYKLCTRETPKKLIFENDLAVCEYIYNSVDMVEVSNLEKLYWETCYLGAPDDDLSDNSIIGTVKKVTYKNMKGKVLTSMLVEDVMSGFEVWIGQSNTMPVQPKDLVYLTGITEKEGKTGRIYKSCANTLCLNNIFGK